MTIESKSKVEHFKIRNGVLQVKEKVHLGDEGEIIFEHSTPLISENNSSFLRRNLFLMKIKNYRARLGLDGKRANNKLGPDKKKGMASFLWKYSCITNSELESIGGKIVHKDGNEK